MKIAWYTPFSNQSAIGHFSQLVVGALRNLEIDVQIIRSENRAKSIRSLAAQCPLEKWRWASDIDRATKSQLADCDLVVYNVGDHYDFHAYCFRHQKTVPGVTILHDYSLHSALNQLCHDTSPDNGTYRDHLATESGNDALECYDGAIRSQHDSKWWQEDVRNYPVYRWALRDTLAVVTHAEFYGDAVAQHIGCPVTTIPLAYDTPSSTVAPTRCLTDGKLTVLTVGAVNANKRHESVIRAIAESNILRDRVEYRIVGNVTDADRRRIQAAVEAQAHRVDVTVTGTVNHETLKAEIAGADAIACLRYPALEGASASVVEALQSGKPVLVCSTGCYAEIPSDFAYHVSPQNEVAEISQTLHALIDDYPSAWKRGQLARRWALQRHSATSYVDQLLRFLSDVLYNQPVLDLTDRIGERLAAWEMSDCDVLMNRIDHAMEDLFANHRAA